MKEYRIIYEDRDKVQDSICIKSNIKPNKIEAKQILNQLRIMKCKKIIDIVSLD